MLVAVTAVCLVGLVFTRSKLLRVGLLLQIGALASNLVLYALILHLDSATSYDPNFPYQWIDVNLPLILTVLNAASLVVLSYGMARWQRARDVGFTVLQALVSGVVVALFLFNIIPIEPFRFFAERYGSSLWFFYLALAAAFFAAWVFLLRLACWKQQRVVTLLLGLGAVLFVFQAPGGFSLFFVLPNLVLYSSFLLSWLLLMLGFLLLIQTERVRKQTQQPQALALPAQRP